MTASGPDERADELLRLAELVTEGLLDFDEFAVLEGEILGVQDAPPPGGEAVPDGEAAPVVSRRRSPDGR